MRNAYGWAGADVRVTVCIVAYRNREDIVRCIAALGSSTYSNLEVVICENGGVAAHAALITSLPATLPAGGAIRVLLASTNLGYGGGFNACLAAAPDADAWWLLNPDAEPEPEALSAMAAILVADEADAVGGTLCLPDGRVQGHGGRFHTWMARAESIGHGSPILPVPDRASVEVRMNYILGASILVGRRFMAVAGPMREDYFLYAEEVEWCLRAKAYGLRLGFTPDALIRHHQGSTTGSANSIADRPWLPVYLDERNRLHIVRDSQPSLLPVAIVAALALILLRYARRRAWAQTGYALAGWWAGVRNQRGVPAQLQ